MQLATVFAYAEMLLEDEIKRFEESGNVKVAEKYKKELVEVEEMFERFCNGEELQ